MIKNADQYPGDGGSYCCPLWLAFVLQQVLQQHNHLKQLWQHERAEETHDKHWQQQMMHIVMMRMMVHITTSTRIAHHVS